MDALVVATYAPVRPEAGPRADGERSAERRMFRSPQRRLPLAANLKLRSRLRLFGRLNSGAARIPRAFLVWSPARDRTSDGGEWLRAFSKRRAPGAQSTAMICPRSEQGFPANPARPSLRTLRHQRSEQATPARTHRSRNHGFAARSCLCTPRVHEHQQRHLVSLADKRSGETGQRLGDEDQLRRIADRSDNDLRVLPVPALPPAPGSRP